MKMNVTTLGATTTTANDENKNSLKKFEGLQNTPDNRKQFLELSDDELKSLQDDAISKEDYESAAVIRDVLKDKTLNENDSQTAEVQEEIDTTKQDNEQKNAKIIEDLKKQLDDSEQQKKTLEDLVKQLQESEKINRGENSKLLEDIKAAKESGDTEKVKKLQDTIKNIALQNKALKDKFAGELPKYDSKDIAKLKTRWITLKLFPGKSKADGETIITLGPQLKFRNNIRSRNRINKTVNKINEIGNDPKKGVEYIMTKASLSQGGRLGTLFKNIKNFFTIRDTNKFDEVFNAHKKQFIDDLESKMSANSMSDTDKKTLTAIKARLDYYQKAYKRQFITV